MTYCDICLSRLPEGRRLHSGSECPTRSPEELEALAEKLLHYQGYRVAGGAIFYIEDDDPDNFRETRIAEAPENPVEAFRLLLLHDFPKSSLLDCSICKRNPVEFLGDLCSDCSLEAAEWARAGDYA
jgi:hypothetical protein